MSWRFLFPFLISAVATGCLSPRRAPVVAPVMSHDEAFFEEQQLEKALMRRYGVSRTKEHLLKYVQQCFRQWKWEGRPVILRSGHIMTFGLKELFALSLPRFGLYHYENEWAFEAFRQKYFLESNRVKKQVSQMVRVGEVVPYDGIVHDGPRGLFDESDSEERSADVWAVREMHRMGIDPRGAVTLLSRGQSSSPRLSWIREEIAHLPPLRDGVIQSDAFRRVMVKIRGGL